MCAWMKLYPSKSEIKQEPYKSVFEHISKNIIANQSYAQPEKPFFEPHYKKPEMSGYITDLKKQMESNKNRLFVDRAERKEPGISEKFSGYPDRPETSAKLRRQIELSRMKDLKSSLDEQIKTKSQSLYLQNSIEKQRIDDIIKEDLKKMKFMERRKEKKKELEKSILTESWSQAIQSKRIENDSIKDISYISNYFH